MPKVIDNVRGRAIAEAREELLLRGYEALTVRNIAKNLGIGLGTFYNYFPSKEYLAACVMLEDWQILVEKFEKDMPGRDADAVLFGLFEGIRSFSQRYISAWEEYGAHASSRSVVSHYHRQLVDQLTEIIRSTLSVQQQTAEPWLASFLGEIILRFASETTVSYSEIEPAVTKLLIPRKNKEGE